ncbi:hypothetical protein HK096_011338, partial [Nowakowskiella sp. JEL0078]
MSTFSPVFNENWLKDKISEPSFRNNSSNSLLLNAICSASARCHKNDEIKALADGFMGNAENKMTLDFNEENGLMTICALLILANKTART